MSVNVNRSVSDQFYRYKMPRLIAKVMACERANTSFIVTLTKSKFLNTKFCIDIFLL